MSVSKLQRKSLARAVLCSRVCALQILIKVIAILNMQYFCILQAIQNWSWGRLGNEDRTSTLTFVSQLGIAKLPVGIYVIAYNSI